MKRKTKITKSKEMVKMLEELKECFQKLQYDAVMFRSVEVSYVSKLGIFNEDNVGWYVKVKLTPPFIEDLSDLLDIGFDLPDNVTSYETSLFYDTDGVYIVYTFNLKDWYDGRDS